MELDNETVGVIGPATDVPFAQIWKAMVEKIHHPEKYLKGVDHVESKANNDGSTYREMTLANGIKMVENIYADEKTGRIEFRVVDRPIIVVNQWLADKKAIEYVVENDQGKVLGWMLGGRDGTLEAIKGQYEKARAL